MTKSVVVLSGSNSGGHITPLNWVATELKKLSPELKVVFIGLKGELFNNILDPAVVDKKLFIKSGKFRRYHGSKHRASVKEWLLNVRDLFNIAAGLLVARKILKKLKPDVVFSKGGSVVVPLGLAAARLKIPIITHDSDAIASLSTRLIARWVFQHCVVFDPKVYPYPPEDTLQINVPINPLFFSVSSAKIEALRNNLNLSTAKPIILVLGGSQGSEDINQIINASLSELLEHYQVIHVLGTLNDKEFTEREGYKVLKFVEPKDMPAMLGLADLVISRAGATAAAEIMAVGRPLIIIPGLHLAQGHQEANARHFEKLGACRMLDGGVLLANPALITNAITDLFSDNKTKSDMLQAQKELSDPAAARKIAELILKRVKSHEKIEA